ncbi:hypothetical protein GXP67_09415 [Rhodocytophaga rosea]|uniref:SGNH/GDSL hydrolase family protein n=1 Tax=Rhodocytophaga rosea TaxID=2704465 RepID=A0A6C0GGP8_9BACT|nr:hypothetical protein [Rhodocytophaga rosea]QHT66860.1 hypothetical protein GXP67_09415 [Rhodocytophaga rosea]
MLNAPFIKSVAFIFILVVVLSIISFILNFGARYSNEGQSGKINQLMRHELDPAIMVFGSSVAYNHFNAELIEQQTGLSCLNMGLDGGPFTHTNGFMRDFISYSKDCQYIVITESYFSFANYQELYEPYKYYPHVSNEHVYNCLIKIEPDVIWKTRYIPFYNLIHFQSKGYLKEVTRGWMRAIGKPMSEKDIKGFHPKHLKWTDEQDNLNKATAPFRVDNIVNEEIFRDFLHMINEINQSGKKVIFVLPPIQKDGQEKLLGLDGLRKKYLSITSENVTFLDYTKHQICNNKSLFYNNTHLNATGADVFSTMFAKDIQELHTGKSTNSLANIAF